jgi:hypothetical protein
MANLQNILLGTLLGMSFMLSSCSSGVTSRSAKTKDVDLKKYKTYSWVKPGDEKYHVTYDKKEAIGYIIELSERALKDKGFEKKAENPDAVFLIDTSLEDRVAYSTQSPVYHQGPGGPMYGGFYGGYYGGYYGVTRTVETEFEQGLLFVEMYDATTKELLWRGWAESPITNKTNINRVVNKAVQKIFKRLPVTHKK